MLSVSLFLCEFLMSDKKSLTFDTRNHTASLQNKNSSCVKGDALEALRCSSRDGTYCSSCLNGPMKMIT